MGPIIMSHLALLLDTVMCFYKVISSHAAAILYALTQTCTHTYTHTLTSERTRTLTRTSHVHARTHSQMHLHAHEHAEVTANSLQVFCPRMKVLVHLSLTVCELLSGFGSAGGATTNTVFFTSTCQTSYWDGGSLIETCTQAGKVLFWQPSLTQLCPSLTPTWAYNINVTHVAVATSSSYVVFAGGIDYCKLLFSCACMHCHTHMHTHTKTNTHAHMPTLASLRLLFVHAYTYSYTTHTHTHVHIHIHIPLHIHIQCSCASTCTRTYTCSCT